MFPGLLKLGNFAVFTYPLFFLLAVVILVFLFWRACRHELVDSQTAFDLLIIAAAGALIGGRIMEFVVRNRQFSWSFERLLFINVWPGFDFWGAILGAGLGLALYLRSRKPAFWQVTDLLAAPLVFAQAILATGRALAQNITVWYWWALGYLLIFLILKRLATKKRWPGFFMASFLVAISLLDLMLFYSQKNFVYFRPDRYLLWGIAYEFLAPAIGLLAGLVIWYILAGRQLLADIKSFFALILLVVFSLRRILTDINDAGRLSRAIIWAPYWLAKYIIWLVRFIFSQLVAAVLDLFYVFGLKKMRQ